MGWTEGYGEKQQSLQGLTSTLMGQAMQEKQNDSASFGGVLKFLGGAVLLMTGNPAAGIPLMGSGATDIF